MFGGFKCKTNKLSSECHISIFIETKMFTTQGTPPNIYIEDHANEGIKQGWVLIGLNKKNKIFWYNLFSSLVWFNPKSKFKI